MEGGKGEVRQEEGREEGIKGGKREREESVREEGNWRQEGKGRGGKKRRERSENLVLLL